MTLKPLYMWAGGKNKLIKHYEPIFSQLPHYDNYVEPFFGGGSIYCWLKNHNKFETASINDIKPEIMGIYESIKQDGDKFLSTVNTELNNYFTHSDKDSRKAYYYDLRQQYWDNPTPEMLFVLMRLGFNGIWQTCTASKGLFGTPAGLLNHKTKEQIVSPEILKEWEESLQTTDLSSVSYEHMDIRPENTLIYLDPPYRDSFTTYGTGFNDEDQKRLVEWSLAQADKGATVLLANRFVEGDTFFENLLPNASFTYFDVFYTDGRRKKVETGYEAKKAREFLAVLNPH